MRVLMTGGGTGGHVNPAIAIANTIKENSPKSEIAFVGTPRGIENRLVPKAGYQLYHVNVMGIRRSFSLSNIKAAYLAAVSPRRAAKIIRDFRPDIVIGTGGYVSWPLIKAAAKAKIPTALHESNAKAGIAVKMLAKYTDRIYVNFEKTAEELDCPSEKILRVGNPTLSPLKGISASEAREKLGIVDKYKYFILSYGGSMGAQRVNESVLQLMRDFTSKRGDIYHLHATGAIEHETAQKQFHEAGLDSFENLKLVEYIYDMPYCQAAADIMICRAGAMTVSEAALMKKCVIFIPSPNVAENHQFKNADALASVGAARLIEEKDLGGGILTDTVSSLIDNENIRREMCEKISAFAVANANRLIYQDIVKLLK